MLTMKIFNMIKIYWNNLMNFQIKKLFKKLNLNNLMMKNVN